MITFLVFILFCWKYVWPALLGIMQEREERIAAGLTAAEKASKDLELAQAKSDEALTDAKQQASEIVEQANKRAQQIVEDAKAQAVTEADRIKTSAQAEVDRQVSQAREELRQKVAVLAITGAEKVLEREVDKSAHDALLTQLSKEL